MRGNADVVGDDREILNRFERSNDPLTNVATIEDDDIAWLHSASCDLGDLHYSQATVLLAA